MKTIRLLTDAKKPAVKKVAVKDAAVAPAQVKTTMKKNEYGEYVVKLWINGVSKEAWTYYTDDKEDAIASAKDMERRAKEDCAKGAKWTGCQAQTVDVGYIGSSANLIKVILESIERAKPSLEKARGFASAGDFESADKALAAAEGAIYTARLQTKKTSPR